jgi:hypothetical protein
LQELQKKSSEKFGKIEMPQIHLDSDGTEIDDEDYFQTLEPNTELIAVFSGEQWIDVSLIMTFLSFYLCLGNFMIEIELFSMSNEDVIKRC